MKKTIIFVSLIAIVLICVLLYFVLPKSIAAKSDLLDINRVTLYEADENQKSITSQVDLESLKDIISSYKCSRISHTFAPEQLESVKYVISGTYAGKPLHIVLGDNINIVYESSDKGGYKILDSDKMILDINQLLK